MEWTREAIKIMKKFAAGVDCPEWDENTVRNTMFNDYCEKIAIKKGKQKIDKEVAKEYILKDHNSIVVQDGHSDNSPIEAIKYCMVRPLKTDKGWVAVHGKATVITITKEEANFLEKKNQTLLKSL